MTNLEKEKKNTTQKFKRNCSFIPKALAYIDRDCEKHPGKTETKEAKKKGEGEKRTRAM